MHVIHQQREVTSPPRPMRRSRSALLGWFDPGEPHRVRGPFTRWPRITDGVLAVLVFLVSSATVAVSAVEDGKDFTLGSIGDQPAGAFVLLALAATALLWRRSRPVEVTAFVMAVMVGWAIAGYGDGQELAVIVAIYAVGQYTTNYQYSLATVVVVIALSILDTVIDGNQRIDIAPAIFLTGLSWYVGLLVRNRGAYLTLLQERAERLEADQHARARQAVADERSRIARELHDVVAHQVSMMTIQAGAAKTIARDDLDAAVDAMGDVERAGRHALGELRHLLGVLRPGIPDQDAKGSDDLGPQPGLADIPALAEELTHTGAEVSLSIAPLPAGLSTAIGLSVYRIVQESITNIIKHAGPRPRVELTIDADNAGLDVTVVNTTAAEGTTGLPESGYGIAGMRERASLLGGTLRAEAEPPNRFCVTLHIPLEQEMS